MTLDVTRPAWPLDLIPLAGIAFVAGTALALGVQGLDPTRKIACLLSSPAVRGCSPEGGATWDGPSASARSTT